MKVFSLKAMAVFILFLSTQILTAAEQSNHTGNHDNYAGDDYHRKISISSADFKNLEPLVIKYQNSHREKAEPISKTKLADLINSSKCMDDTMRDFAKMFYGNEADPTIQSLLKMQGIKSVTPHISIIKDEPMTLESANERMCDIQGVGRISLRPWISVSADSVDALTEKLKIPKQEPWVEVLTTKEGKSIVNPDLKENLARAVASKIEYLKERYASELKNIQIQEQHPIFKAMPKN